jgi:Trk K+ transport system NAD-binding subunit
VDEGQRLSVAARELAEGAELRVRPDGALVVVGSPESVRALQALAAGAVSVRRDGPFLVGGAGEVGRKVGELLRLVGEEVCLVDRQPGEWVDLVGDMLDAKTLEAAGVREAQGVILALDSDSATLFATVILKDLVPTVPVIARVNQAENVDRIHRAGADFALSISQVSGAMLAKKLLGQEAVTVDAQLKVLRAPAGTFDGRRVEELRLRERTGCSLVAVERGELGGAGGEGGEVRVRFEPGFRFEPGDGVYVCGSAAAIRRFSEVYGSA